MLKRFIFAAPIGVLACPALLAAPPNPLVGSWILESYVDTPEGGDPVYAFGKPPSGLFIFTADGRVSVDIMRNPPNAENAPIDKDPDACIPAWYCSYYGTYTYDPSGPSWTTHVIGGNIPNYIGTDQRRNFVIVGDRITISETYEAEGRTFRAVRILRRARPLQR